MAKEKSIRPIRYTYKGKVDGRVNVWAKVKASSWYDWGVAGEDYSPYADYDKWVLVDVQ